GLVLLAGLLFGCYNSDLNYSIPEDSESLNNSSEIINGVRGTVKIPGMKDASNCLVIVERQIDGIRTASVYETTNRGISDYDLLFSSIFSVYTDKNGIFEVTGMPEGTYTVTVKKENTLGAVVKDVVVRNDRAIVDIDIVLTATGRITGRVTLSDTTSDMYGSFVYAEGTSYIAATDGTGDFCIKSIPIGTYNIVFYHEGYNTYIKSNFTVTAAIDNSAGTIELSKISKNVYLSDLTISNGTMLPIFNKSITYYDVTVDGTVNTVTFTPSAEDSNSIIKINGVVVESGVASGNLSINIGKNIFSIDAISENGEIRNYVVVVEKIITTVYTVTFETNGGSAVDNQNIIGGNKIIKPADPTRTGYTFSGWYLDSTLKNEWLFNVYTVSENITLYAKWDIITYNITYNLNDVTNDAGNPTTYTVETDTITLLAPTKSGYTFGGWYSDAGFLTAVIEITLGTTGDKELWAKWVAYGIVESLLLIEKQDIVSIIGASGNSYTQAVSTSAGFFHNISTFNLGKYEVTYELWYTVYQWAVSNGYTFANAGIEGNDGTAGAAPTAAKYEPVTTINWRDTIVWCNAYSEMSGFTPCYTYSSAIIKDSQDTNATACDGSVCNWSVNGYRLPSEGEWQFAASNKGATPYNYASGGTGGYTGVAATDYLNFSPFAWFGNSTIAPNGNATSTKPVGTTTSLSALTLWDMSGNVWEWCWDWYGNYPAGAQSDYRGAVSGSGRIHRGGSYSSSFIYLFIGLRRNTTPISEYNDIGFRIARSAP
nr:SUMF1/EgtB/PvdO family nonheme iron enzyme [Spirochaetota bacterium]